MELNWIHIAISDRMFKVEIRPVSISSLAVTLRTDYLARIIRRLQCAPIKRHPKKTAIFNSERNINGVQEDFINVRYLYTNNKMKP